MASDAVEEGKKSSGNGQPTISRIHTVRFSYAHLIVLLAFTVPIVVWLINEHYDNKHYHDAQDRINARVEMRISVLEEHYASMMEQHQQILGRLDVIQSNQQIVLEAIAGVRRQNYGIRKALEDAP